jgi:malonyl CoA-acyl carrier protein transacylase/SAM-dependent methyltransferase
VLAQGRPAEQPLWVGSVKTNLGHTEAAAGVAGLIKTVLALHHGEIPAHLHLSTLNPHIAALNGAIHIPREAEPWPARSHALGHRRMAGVSSFGLSGTNAHLIVEAAPDPQPAVDVRAQANRAVAPNLVTLSARSERSLHALAHRYATHLDAAPQRALEDIAYTANVGRTHHAHRIALVATSTSDLRTQLGQVTIRPPADSPRPPGVTFLFTGQGAHYAGMGRTLYATEAAFRTSLDESAALLATLLDRSLTDILFGPESEALLAQMRYAQPALCALQLALCALWQSWGITPGAVAGHSAGEYAAAVVAGVMSPADGLSLIAERGRLMDSLAGSGQNAVEDDASGGMVALFAPEPRVAEAVAHVVAQQGNVVGIAAINGPAHVVISGRPAALHAVVAELALGDDERRTLAIGMAAHSPLVEPILPSLAKALARVQLNAPQITFVSTLTGGAIGDEITDPAYWQQQMRAPVRFAQAVETLYAEGQRIFVEIGPHPTLIGMAQRCLAANDATWVPSLSRKAGEDETMLTGLASLYVDGAEVDWRAFHVGRPGRRIALPTYAWDRQRYWSPAATVHLHIAHTPSKTAAWPAAVAAAQRQADQGPLDLRLDTFVISEAALDQLALAYIIQALHEMGAFTQAGDCRTVDALLQQQGIAPTYRPLLQRWLADLAGAGLLRQVEPNRFCADAPLPAPEIPARLAEAAATAPPELLAYVERCGGGLHAVLTGSESALATLFPDGSYDTVDFLYSEWAPARYINAIVRAAVETIAQHVTRPGRPLRVLEVGAGTGGTAAALLPALPAQQTRYLFTDVSDFFLARAAERFAAYPFVEFALLNIETAPNEQGVALHSQDLVVAANVLHATRDLDATLRYAQSLLAPGGVLLLYEGTRHPRWLSVTTGLIEGWQRFEDTWRTDQPLLDAPTWEAALHANGFVEVIALPAAGHPADVLGQHLLMARAPGEPTTAVAAEATAQGQQAEGAAQPFASAAPPAPAALPEAEALQAALATALPAERTDLLVAFVRQSIAHVLRLRDWQSLKRNQPLLDLGFDSLMAVELRNVLRQGLALPRKLPATLLFDHPSIAAIAAYLEKMLDEGAPAAVAVASLEPAGAAAESTGMDDLALLSDAEVEALLLKKLTQL